MPDEDVIVHEEVPVATNGHRPAPVKRLSALDKVFEATGECVVRCGMTELVLPIQAVDLELVEVLCRPYRAIPRVSVSLVSGKRQEVAHLQDPAYLEAVSKFNRINSYVYVLCALRCEIADRAGRIVWNDDNSIHEIDASIAALKEMGIVDGQLVTILNAVQALTQAVEEAQVSD